MSQPYRDFPTEAAGALVFYPPPGHSLPPPHTLRTGNQVRNKEEFSCKVIDVVLGSYSKRNPCALLYLLGSLSPRAPLLKNSLFFFRSTGWPILLVLFFGTVLKRPQLTETVDSRTWISTHHSRLLFNSLFIWLSLGSTTKWQLRIIR